MRIVALSDLTLERADAKREAFALTEARSYADVEEMLGAEDLDLVSITTPPSAHREVAVRALEAGVDVIVEKPMAPSLEDCDAMLDAQRRSGRLLSVIAQNRFRDEMMVLKAVLDSGELGPVSHARIASEWWRGLSYYDLWWRGTWASEGGGCTLNHAIHHIDLALWLLGSPQAVAAMMTNAQHHNAEVEDLAVAILQYERGLAELTSSVVHHGQQQEIVVQAERARISQPWSVVAETAQPNGFPTSEGDSAFVAELDAFAESLPRLEHTGHAGQLRDVIAAIRDGRDPLISGEDGRRALELVTAIYAAAIERRTIDLPIPAEDPYYRAGTLEARAPHFFEKTASVASQDGGITVGGSSDTVAPPASATA
ncbi:Gfo/Idh/MocA family oxidoreductase [Brachybacterium sacelli]